MSVNHQTLDTLMNHMPRLEAFVLSNIDGRISIYPFEQHSRAAAKLRVLRMLREESSILTRAEFVQWAEDWERAATGKELKP